MRKVFDAIETVGPTDATVLITGESGTGKELVARAIHHASPRRFHPLVAIHCGALTETLLESELFGHEKAHSRARNTARKANSKLPKAARFFSTRLATSLKTQTDLLRVLQEREITRVGGNQNIKVDFRCIAATNKDLEKLIEEGKFRPDLFYRLNVFRIELPPLRERRDDIPVACRPFRSQVFSGHEQAHQPRFSRRHESAAAAALGRKCSRAGKFRRARHGCGTGAGTARARLHLQDSNRRQRRRQDARRHGALTSCAWSRNVEAIKAMPRRYSTSTGSRSITS
jgi:transcriptional regulator with GAF, ATPase, and Fis domain